VTRWTELCATIESGRPFGDRRRLENALITELKRAAGIGICSRSAVHWITHQKVGDDREEVGLLKYGDADLGKHHAIRLYGLPWVDDAVLSLMAVVERSGSVWQYTVSVVGRRKNTNTGWYVRVDLDPGPRGSGPCSHPLLHCHVGEDATARNVQEVRAPLPSLGADEALTWILATMDPRLEP